MTELFVKEFKILNPDSEIARSMGIEAPALVPPFIDRKSLDQHKKPFSPLTYGIGRVTGSENYCLCTCTGGIWVRRYMKEELPRQPIAALCRISKERKSLPDHDFAVKWVMPYEMLPVRCAEHRDKVLSAGYLFVAKDTLYPTCGRDIRAHYSIEVPYKFAIKDGEILFQLNRSWRPDGTLPSICD